MSSDCVLDSRDPVREQVLEPVLEPGLEVRDDGRDCPLCAWPPCRGMLRPMGPMAMRPAASSASTCFLWRLRCRKRFNRHLQKGTDRGSTPPRAGKKRKNRAYAQTTGERGGTVPGRTDAQHDSEQAAEDAAGDERGSDEAQLERLEALLARAHEGDHHADGHRAQPDVEQRVGRRALVAEGERHLVLVRAGAAERRVVDLPNSSKEGVSVGQRN